jgi:hypothetical protein
MKTIQDNPEESRRMDGCLKEKNSNVSWKQFGNKKQSANRIWSLKVFEQKPFIHNNPVESGFVQTDPTRL